MSGGPGRRDGIVFFDSQQAVASRRRWPAIVAVSLGLTLLAGIGLWRLVTAQ